MMTTGLGDANVFPEPGGSSFTAVTGVSKQSKTKTTPPTNGLLQNDARLHSMIETRYGLLEELQSRNVFRNDKIEALKSERTVTQKVNLMLSEVAELPIEQQQQFLSALDSTQQSHVTNFIRCKGQRPSPDDNDWPIVETDHYGRINAHRKDLISNLYPFFGLLDLLFTAECINRNQLDELREMRNSSSPSHQLMTILERKSVAVYRKFVDCLIKNNQSHLASLLDPSIARYSKPLTEDQKKLLQVRHSELVYLITTESNGFVHQLLSCECITIHQKEYIDAAGTNSDRNNRLLEIVTKGSVSGLQKFIDCLKATGQEHVATILTDNAAVIAEIKSTTNLSANDEEIVCNIFREITLRGPPTLENDETLDPFTAHGIKVRILQPGSCIKLFICCRSQPQLLRLTELYASGELKDIVQRLYSGLLDHQKQVYVEDLVWASENFNSCMRDLLMFSGLPLLSRIYEFDRQLPNVALDRATSTTSIVDQIPHELIEMLLVKTAVFMFVVVKTLTSQSILYTMTSLNAVCEYWWQTLTARKWNRSRLKRLFTRACRPYRYNPKYVTTIDTASASVITGVAELNDRLYVVTKLSGVVQVFDIGSAFTQLEHIKVPGLKNPHDIAVCSAANCLFIADYDTRCIWRLNTAPNFNVDKFIWTQYVPFTLSVRSGRVLVTPADGSTLYVYANDGKQLKHIPLPEHINACHAVETRRDSFMVGHRQLWIGSQIPDSTTVFELSVDGKVLCAYQSSVRYSRFLYLTIDASEHVLMADQENKVILQLDSDLRSKKLILKQVVLTEVPGHPLKMCYSQRTGHLYLCDHSSSKFFVYAIAS